MTHVNGGRSLSEDEGGHQARPRNVMDGQKLSHPSDRQHWAQHVQTFHDTLLVGLGYPVLRCLNKHCSFHTYRLNGIRNLLCGSPRIAFKRSVAG